MSDFLFHKVSEKEKESIRKEAKKIMDDFSKKLSKIDNKISEPIISREESEREEGRSREEDKEFRKIMFENAPNKSEDFIVSEKKKW